MVSALLTAEAENGYLRGAEVKRVSLENEGPS